MLELLYERSIIIRIDKRSFIETSRGNLFCRGEKYYRAGKVKKLILSDNILTATVNGTCRYKTSLTVKNGFLCGSCSCPLGEEGEFCKHLVAMGLAFLNGEYITREYKNSFDWNAFIKRCSREVLEQIVFEMTPSCPDIVEEYRMKNLSDDPEKLIDELKQKFNLLIR